MVSLKREGSCDDLARFGYTGDSACADGLYQDVAGRGCLAGTCNHRPASGVRGELVEQLIARTTSDDMDAINALPSLIVLDEA